MKIGLLLADLKGELVLDRLIGKADIAFVVSYDTKTLSGSFQKIKDLCSKNGLRFIDRSDFRPDMADEVDHAFVIGWQHMIHGDLSKFVIIHDSRLPAMKGWSPTVQALILGESHLYATAFQATNVMDTGKVFDQASSPIAYPIRISEANVVLAGIYARLILNFNPRRLPPLSDPNESYSMWRDEQDYRIKWTWDSNRIQRFIHAVGFPYDGARFNLGTDRIAVMDCDVIHDVHIVDRDEHLGKVFKLENGEPTVVCGSGLIKLRDMYLDGKPFLFKKLRSRLA